MAPRQVAARVEARTGADLAGAAEHLEVVVAADLEVVVAADLEVVAEVYTRAAAEADLAVLEGAEAVPEAELAAEAVLDALEADLAVPEAEPAAEAARTMAAALGTAARQVPQAVAAAQRAEPDPEAGRVPWAARGASSLRLGECPRVVAGCRSMSSSPSATTRLTSPEARWFVRSGSRRPRAPHTRRGW